MFKILLTGLRFYFDYVNILGLTNKKTLDWTDYVKYENMLESVAM